MIIKLYCIYCGKQFNRRAYKLTNRIKGSNIRPSSANTCSSNCSRKFSYLKQYGGKRE
jgi:hypothetical protein